MLKFSKKTSFYKILTIVGILSFLFNFHTSYGQSAEMNSVENKKAQLENELRELEKEIAEKQAILDSQKVKSVSLERDLSILGAKVDKTKLGIKSQNIIIEKLSKEITDKKKTIENLSEKSEREKDSLAQLIRKTNEIDNSTIIHVILSSQTLSDFYGDLDSFSSIKDSVKTSLDEIKSTKQSTESEKEQLQKKQEAEIDAKMKIESEKKLLEKNEKEQKSLLNISKNKEKEYQKVLKEREKKAAEIRTALFSLRDSAAIPFGKALEYANAASSKTGVRPALILAILQQESNMGANVGTCNRPGDPLSKSWKEIMPGPLDKAAGRSRRDDQTIFLRITSGLGISPDGTPLSCPWGNGWGGAMGPSQFIPSTWEMFENRIAKALGVKIANPWEASHAVMATAYYMSDLGADAGGYTAERNAACKYYSGRSCDSKKPANSFYGNEVWEKAQNIQENMIDVLAGL